MDHSWRRGDNCAIDLYRYFVGIIRYLPLSLSVLSLDLISEFMRLNRIPEVCNFIFSSKNKDFVKYFVNTKCMFSNILRIILLICICFLSPLFASLETCCDYIRVYDGPSTLSPLLDEIQEYKNKRYNSSNNDLTVLFYSDHSISRRGFHASWVPLISFPSESTKQNV